MKELNLIPYELKKKRDKETSAYRAILYGIIAIFIILVMLYIPNIVLNYYISERNQLKLTIDDNNSVSNEKGNLISEINSYKIYTEKIDSIKKGKILLSDKIRGIQKFVPKDLTIKTLTYNNEVITIDGTTNNYNSISEFVANLQLTDDYKNARINSITNSQGGSPSCDFDIVIN
jgi:type IV pilus assembly protein PilN